jgi:LPXTG-site transpeptidase (sortase) family protein
MDRPWSGAGRRRAVVLLAGLAGLAGVALVVVGVRAQQSAPRPHPAGALPPSPVTTGSHAARPQVRSEPQPLGPSRPTRLRIPAIGVDTVVNRIGLAADGTLAVPQPGPHLDEAAWFENSPTPGQPGPAIIEGHVDSPSGPSVFFRLGALHPGDKLLVTRADGVRLTFTVQAIRDFAKSDFPTRVVYGGDLSTPQLRLITCSDFDRETHHHEGNEVVYSHLTHVAHRPGPGEKAGS